MTCREKTTEFDRCLQIYTERISFTWWFEYRPTDSCCCQYIQMREWAAPQWGLVAGRGEAWVGMAKVTPGGNSSNCCYVPGSASNQIDFVRHLGNSLAMLLLSLMRCNKKQLYNLKLVPSNPTTRAFEHLMLKLQRFSKI